MGRGMRWIRLQVLAASIATFTAPAATPVAAQEYGSQDDGLGETLPPDFQGRITYQGSFSAEASRAGRAPANASAIVRRIANGNSRAWAEDGTITITVEFDGNRVQGSHVGSGGMGRGTFTGTRNGRSCTISSGQGDVNTVSCTRSMWSGVSRSAPGARVVATTRVETRATQVFDARLEARERAAAAARAAEEERRLAQTRPQASPARASQNVTARASAPSSRERPAGPRNASYRAQLINALHLDSRSWINNRLHAGTERDAGITGREGNAVVYRVEYRVSGFFSGDHALGWIEGKFVGGALQRIRYFDAQEWASVRTDAMRAEASAAQSSSEAQEDARARERCISENQWRLIPDQFC